jgi:hypothetical protein
MSIEKKLSLLTPEERISNIIVESGASNVIEKALDQSSKADSVEEMNAVTRGFTSSIEGMQNVDDEVKKFSLNTEYRG